MLDIQTTTSKQQDEDHLKPSNPTNNTFTRSLARIFALLILGDAAVVGPKMDSFVAVVEEKNLLVLQSLMINCSATAAREALIS